jgi:hypothetical protein
MVPSIHLKDSLVILGKHAMRVPLPEDPCTRPDEVVVEHALVERSLPSASI